MTDKTTEALKLAEEALHHAIMSSGGETGCNHDYGICFCKEEKALAAIREVLADHIADAGKVIAEPVKHYKKALDAWFEKTEWVQETAKPKELGMHRADVLKQRIHELEKQIAAPVSEKREWVDLTPIELAEAFSDKGSADAGIRAVITAFKEKNT